jgi:hypothetical protein
LTSIGLINFVIGQSGLVQKLTSTLSKSLRTLLMRIDFFPVSAIMRSVAKQQQYVAREGTRVIRLDLARLSRAELERTVTERCTKFGTVLAVVIVQDSAHYDFALASVEMSTRDEAREVLRYLGESLVDDAVMIRLEQDPAP